MISLNLIKQHFCINTRKTFYTPHLTTLFKNSEIFKGLLTNYHINNLNTGSLEYLPSYAMYTPLRKGAGMGTTYM